VLEVDRGEQRAVREQALGLPEEQHAVLGEREVEARQDTALHLRGEVHERVAADQQVDPRDGGVLDEVVAAEDHRAAQLLTEGVPAADGFEVARAQLLGHAFDLAVGVDAGAGLAQRLVVDVRGVDLHAVAELLRAEHLGQDHATV
jgi:hypothetical protein